jgi:primosomal protein N' (replication factor Y) (superfamily II helicase)
MLKSIYESLKKGIDDYSFIMHGKISKKKQALAWKSAIEKDHPVLVIATPMFSSIPRKDLSTIILEKESSRGYFNFRAPFIDFRDYIESYAKHLGIRLIFGDSMLRINTLYRKEQGELTDFFPISYRIDKEADVLIVKNVKDKKDKSDKGRNEKESKQSKFSPLTEELVSMIQYSQEKNDRIFIFCTRRGLSPQTICHDCGENVKCEHCGAPVVLHQNKKSKSADGSYDRFFLCHHCGHQRSAFEKCKKCQSWNLDTLGIAIDSVASEIKKMFPKREIYMVDKDTTSTTSQTKEMIEKFNKSQNGILLGTESSLSFLPKIKYSAIASLDSLFSIPDFRINERIMHIILKIIEQTESYVLIQTRSENAQILDHISTNNLSQFYRDEINSRKEVGYPPFSNHIKITVEDTKPKATDLMKRLQDKLESIKNEKDIDFNTMIFPAFVPVSKDRSMLHLLISINTENRNDNQNDKGYHKLKSLLKSLPEDYQVRVNPESLL